MDRSPDYRITRSPDLLSPLRLQVVQERVHHLSAGVVGQLCGFALHVAHQALEVIAGIGDAHHSDRSPLPQVGAVDLSHGDIKRVAEAIFDTAQDLALVLERMRSFDAQLQSEVSDGHVPDKKLTADRRGSTRISPERIPFRSPDLP